MVGSRDIGLSTISCDISILVSSLRSKMTMYGITVFDFIYLIAEISCALHSYYSKHLCSANQH